MPTQQCIQQHKRTRATVYVWAVVALALSLLMISSASANHHRHHHPHDHLKHHRIHHPHHGWVWVVPTVVGGVVAYELAKQQRELEILRQQQELNRLREPIIVPQLRCSQWLEREVGGQIVRERICEQ